MEKIREVVGKEYANTLGIIAYKNGQKVIEEYFKGAHEIESIHTFSIVKSIVAILVGIPDVPNANVYDRASQEAFYKVRDNRGWVKDPSGYYTTEWGVSLTTDEFAKIGVLVLNNGLYNGKRILSEQYIREMLKEREESYGYLWWIYKKNSMIKIIRKEYSTGKYLMK